MGNFSSDRTAGFHIPAEIGAPKILRAASSGKGEIGKIIISRQRQLQLRWRCCLIFLDVGFCNFINLVSHGLTVLYDLIDLLPVVAVQSNPGAELDI